MDSSNIIDLKTYYSSFASAKKLFNILLEKEQYPLTCAVQYGLTDVVIYIDDMLRNKKGFIEKYDIKPQWHDERFCISWIHVEIAMRNKDYKLVKILCSRLRSRYFKLRYVVVDQWTQQSALSTVRELAIKTKDFNQDINEFLIKIFTERYSYYTKEVFTSMNTSLIMESNNTQVLDFYNPLFKVEEFNKCIFDGYANTVKWMEEHQPEICVIEENHMFLEYPFCNRPFDFVRDNDLEGLKMYFKYLCSIIKPSTFYYLIEENKEILASNPEMFDLLNEYYNKYFL